jgi:hypothetical protein
MGLAYQEFLKWGPLRKPQWSRMATGGLWLLAIICAFNNWEVRLYPESIEANNQLLTVTRRLSDVMQPNDVLFTPYGGVATYLPYFNKGRVYSMYYEQPWSKEYSFEENRSAYFAGIDNEIRLVRKSGGRVFIERLFDPSINDLVNPWTDYKRSFGWHNARQDIEQHLQAYERSRVFSDIDDLWILN